MSYEVEQTKNGKTYIYKCESYWDKEKKQPRRSRPCAYDDSNSPKDGSVRGCRLYKKGKKSAIAVARQFGGRKRNFNGEKLWARGYAV